VTEATSGLLRTRERTARVTNVELFFDLVYVFAVTQLSHYLLDHRSVTGARQATLLLALVWLASGCAPPSWSSRSRPSTTGYTAGSDRGCVDG
jgi:low temperature requirement protein LtrA